MANKRKSIKTSGGDPTWEDLKVLLWDNPTWENLEVLLRAIPEEQRSTGWIIQGFKEVKPGVFKAKEVPDGPGVSAEERYHNRLKTVKGMLFGSENHTRGEKIIEIWEMMNDKNMEVNREQHEMMMHYMQEKDKEDKESAFGGGGKRRKRRSRAKGTNKKRKSKKNKSKKNKSKKNKSKRRRR